MALLSVALPRQNTIWKADNVCDKEDEWNENDE